MHKEKTRILNVIKGSIADEAGIEKGDILLSINTQPIEDVFDYRFLMADEELNIEFQKQDGEIWEVDIEKDEYEDLGIEFENSMMDDSKSCTNKCIFCFIDQLPQKMRKTLYFKDDDSRLSFFMGNYVTLTNMKNKDIERIIRYRMSPINVSVHTTNPKLRCFMLNNNKAGDLMSKIKLLADGGIEVNCQIVLLRGLNDSAELDKTIKDLTLLFPAVRSISIVPVGITGFREGLYPLEPYDKESSLKVIEQVEDWQKRLLAMHGSRIVYLADEFYIMAGIDLPDSECYEDFPQIENGVGLISLLRDEFYEYLKEIDIALKYKKTPGVLLQDEFYEYLKKIDISCENTRVISIATGSSAFKYIKELAKNLEDTFNIDYKSNTKGGTHLGEGFDNNDKCKNLIINVYEIKNRFFGETITVTGLLTGFDIVSELSDKDLGEELLICRCMLKANENIFLDDYTVDMIEEKLKVKVRIVENSGKDFIRKCLNMVG